MGLQTRYFGRWVLPIFPIACLLAAHFALELHGWAVGALERRLGAPRARRGPRAGGCGRSASGSPA